MACACGAGLPDQGQDPGLCRCQGESATHCACSHQDGCSDCGRIGWHTQDCASRAAEPAPDRLAEAREAMARWLHRDHDCSQYHWDAAPEDERGEYLGWADALLALPEVAALLGGERQ